MTYFFRTGYVIARAVEENGRLDIDVLDTLTNRTQSGRFDVLDSGRVSVRIVKSAVGQVINQGLRNKNVLRSHLTFREVNGEPRLAIMRTNNHGEALNGPLGAWEPKVVKGGWQPKQPEEALPHTLEDLQAFEVGFLSAVEVGMLAPERHDANTLSIPHSAPWREGYAVGRRCRGNPRVSTFIYALIAEKKRRLEREARRQERAEAHEHMVRRQRAHGDKMPPARHGGPSKPAREVARIFATSDKPAHTTKTPGGKGYYSLWISETGITIYSYAQPIAQKRKRDPLDNVVYCDPRKFSTTTSKFQTWVGAALRREGWKVEYRNLGDA